MAFPGLALPGLAWAGRGWPTQWLMVEGRGQEKTLRNLFFWSGALPLCVGELRPAPAPSSGCSAPAACRRWQGSAYGRRNTPGPDKSQSLETAVYGWVFFFWGRSS